MREQKRKIIIISLVGLLLIMAISYAAFSSVLNIQGTTSISSNWNIKITNVTSKDIVGSASNQEEPSWENLTATFNTNLVSPGDSITYEITVSNEGTLNAKLDKITLSDTNNPAIKFETSGLTEGDILNAGSNTTLNVKVSYDINITSQPASTISVLTANLEYSQADGSGSSSQTAAEQLIATTVTSGDGLYQDDYGYIYKGANPNNYITFNNEVWSIVSVEDDETLKIVRNESLGSMAWDSTDNDWATSSLNAYLNDDYYLTLSDASNIVSHAWNIGAVTWEDTLTNQVKQERSLKYTGNIGLINMTDYIRSNTNTASCGTQSLIQSNYSTCKSSTWLFRSLAYWVISPNIINSDLVFLVNGVGAINNDFVNDSLSLYPALYLTSETQIIDGVGTSSDPYQITI